LPALARAVLRFAEIPYAAAIRYRNYRYDTGAARIQRIAACVVSVGNLTLGGTGKTPMVEWLAEHFRGCGVGVAVLSRGYGSEGGRPNDEALELKEKLPEVAHLQSADRVGAARRALIQTGCRVILLDDAFQHRRIARDLDIVLLDALEPFGFGHLFPRGWLREPIEGLRRADVVVLTRADLVCASRREQIRAQAGKYAPKAIWAEAIHAPQTLRNSTGCQMSIDSLKGKPVAAFAGLGNPAGFRGTLANCGYRVVEFREFADHHRYCRQDIETLAGWAEDLKVEAAVCTQKDLVKLGVQRLGSVPLWALTVRLEFMAGEEAVRAKLRAILAGEGTADS